MSNARSAETPPAHCFARFKLDIRERGDHALISLRQENVLFHEDDDVCYPLLSCVVVPRRGSTSIPTRTTDDVVGIQLSCSTVRPTCDGFATLTDDTRDHRGLFAEQDDVMFIVEASQSPLVPTPRTSRVRDNLLVFSVRSQGGQLLTQPLHTTEIRPGQAMTRRLKLTPTQ